jgi:hypothetical protein
LWCPHTRIGGNRFYYGKKTAGVTQFSDRLISNLKTMMNIVFADRALFKKKALLFAGLFYLGSMVIHHIL